MTETYVEKPKTLAELRAGIATGVKATDSRSRYYDRIAAGQSAAERVSEPDQRARAGAGGADRCGWPRKAIRCRPLAGIPVGIKDVLVMQGAPATAGSKILKGYRPPYDATAVATAGGGRRGAAGQAELR